MVQNVCLIILRLKINYRVAQFLHVNTQLHEQVSILNPVNTLNSSSTHNIFVHTYLSMHIKAPLLSFHWWNTRSSWHWLYLQWGLLWGHLLTSLSKPPFRPLGWPSLLSPQLILHWTVVMTHRLSKHQSPRKWTGWSESKWQMPIWYGPRTQCW